jgi:hypothetical protein
MLKGNEKTNDTQSSRGIKKINHKCNEDREVGTTETATDRGKYTKENLKRMPENRISETLSQ